MAMVKHCYYLSLDGIYPDIATYYYMQFQVSAAYTRNITMGDL